MTENEIKLCAAIHALAGYCSASPKAITPVSNADELLGAWNRWFQRLDGHYLKTLLEAYKDAAPTLGRTG